MVRIKKSGSSLIIVLLIVGVLSTKGIGQDSHFTQFYNSPQYLNPALVGTFQGLYRVSTSYRDQWRLSTGSPINTFSVGGDLKFDIGDKWGGEDIIGGGIMFFGDRVGLLDYNTNQIALSASYHKLLDKRTQQYIGIGIQGGIVQKEVNYEDLTFQDQFNAVDGYFNATAERLPANNLGYGDFSIGINYSIVPSKGHRSNVGLAVFHLLSPSVSFYARDALLSRQISVEDNISRKWVFHSSYTYPYSEAVSLEPRVIYMQQGKFKELALNMMTKVKSLELANQGFFAGPGIRLADGLSGGLVPASVMLTVGYEYRGLIIGASYDHSILDIAAGRNGFNSFEISLNYWGSYDNGSSLCPKF